MRFEHLKYWLVEAREEKDPNDSRWRSAVQSVELAVEMGYLATDYTWSMADLILKWGGEPMDAL